MRLKPVNPLIFSEYGSQEIKSEKGLGIEETLEEVEKELDREQSKTDKQ